MMYFLTDGASKCNSHVLFRDSMPPSDFEPSTKELRRIAYTIIAPVLIVIGILGNILNLLVLNKPCFNNCTRIYLRALAIADICILIFDITMILRLSDRIGNSFHTAVYFAYIEVPIVTMFIAFSVYIITCLTIDRYISVCAPTTFNSFHTSKMAKGAILMCTCIAILLASPLYLLKTICQNGVCKWSFMDNVNVTKTMYWYAYIIISEVMIRTGPALVVAILNILIIKKLKTIKKMRHNFHRTSVDVNKDSVITNYINRTKKYKEEKRLVVLLQIVSVLFLATIIPASCLSVWYTFQDGKNIRFEKFRAAANILEMTNFALNFFAYFLCSKEFRRGLMSIFKNVNADKKRANKENACKQTGKQIATIIEQL